MAAQKRHRYKNKYIASPKKTGFYKLIFVFLILLVSFVILKLSTKTKYWHADNRLVMVIQQKDGDVLVSSIDPVNKEIVNLIIPGSTEVEVAGNLGKRKLMKVWDLGIQENREGELLMSTVTSYFRLPIQVWGDVSATGLVKGGFLNTAKSILSSQSNLTIGDKIKLSLFASSINNVRRLEIKLSDTPFLKQMTVSDGSEGYLFSGELSPKIYSYFTDYYFKDMPPRVVIIGTEKGEQKTKMIAKIIETLGGKIVSLSKENLNSINHVKCTVGPGSDKRSEIISTIFGCTLSEMGSKENFDLIIKLEKKFSLFY